MFAGQLDDGRVALPERSAEHRLEHRRPHCHDGLVGVDVAAFDAERHVAEVPRLRERPSRSHLRQQQKCIL